MEDNKLIRKVKSYGVYQLILTFIISLLNTSIYFPNYLISYSGTPPYVNYYKPDNTTVTSILNYEICVMNFTINKTLTKTNFLLDYIEYLPNDSTYCYKFSITLIYVALNLPTYIYLITNLSFRPRVNYIFTCFVYFLGVIFFSMYNYIGKTYDHNFIKDSIEDLLVFHIFSSSILTSSLHFISGVTCIKYRQQLIYLITTISSTVSLISSTFIYDNNINQESFFLIINIFPALSILLATTFYFISVENPKYYSNSDIDLIRNTLTHICKINYCSNKTEFIKKIESFDLDNIEILEVHPRKQNLVNSIYLKSLNILLYMLLYLIIGFIFQYNTLAIIEFSKDIDIYSYIIMFLTIVIFILMCYLIKNCEMMIYSTISFILLSFVNIFIRENPYLQISQKIIFEYTIGNIFANSLTYYFRVIDRKRRLVNTILMLCYYHGCSCAPFGYFYLQKVVSKILITFLGFIVLILQLIINIEYKKRLKDKFHN